MFEKQQKIFGQFISFGSKPTAETFPELPECIIWMRFFLAVNYGIYAGLTVLTNEKGAIPLLMGLNFVAFAPIMYTMTILQADSDSYGGKLLFAGLANAMALVLLIWIYYYTWVHEAEEETLRQLLSVYQASQPVDSSIDGNPADVGADAGAAVPPPTPPMEESEF